MGKYPDYAEVVPVPELDADILIDCELVHRNPDDRLLRDVECDLFLIERIDPRRDGIVQRILRSETPHEKPLVIVPDMAPNFDAPIRAPISWLAKFLLSAYLLRKVPFSKGQLTELKQTRRQFLKTVGGLTAIAVGSEFLYPTVTEHLGESGANLADRNHYFWHHGFNITARSAEFADNTYDAIEIARRDFGYQGRIVAGVKMGQWHCEETPTFEELLRNTKLRQQVLKRYAKQIARKNPWEHKIMVYEWDDAKQNYPTTHFYDPNTCERTRTTTTYKDSKN